MNAEFPQTRLTLLERIRSGNDEARKAALELFIENYHRPLVDFLVRSKHATEADAEDLVQEFMVNKVLTGKILNHDAGKGRFRSLLRVAIQRDFLNRMNKANRERIEFERDPESLQPSTESESDFIDRAWAIAVFSSALLRLKSESIHWDLFRDRVISQPPIPYPELVEKHDIASPEKASNLLITAKRAFNRFLTESIREQSSWTESCSEEELDHEIEYLRECLSDRTALQTALDSIDDKHCPASLSVQLSHGPGSPNATTFIPELPEENWTRADWPDLLSHVLMQPLGELIDTEYPASFNSFLQSEESDALQLSICKQLKDKFNHRAKLGGSPLPVRVDIVLTFVAIAKFVCLGGALGDITTMSSQDFANGLRSLLRKDWISNSVQEVFRKALMVIE